jgi:prepilin-type processing-associated H-X9-DG protein
MQFGSSGTAQFKSAYSTPLKLFICPSDTGFVGNHSIHTDRTWPNDGAVPVSNYMGNSGHYESAYTSTATPPCSQVQKTNSGIMWGDSYCRMADVIDGTSNTIAFGERESLTGRGGAWIGVYNPAYSFGNNVQLGPSLVMGNSQPKPNEIENVNGGYYYNSDRAGPVIGYTSLHPNGVQFAFCDGSVRWINNQIQHNWQSQCGALQPGGPNPGSSPADEKILTNGVYQRLMSRSDKWPINADF